MWRREQPTPLPCKMLQGAAECSTEEFTPPIYVLWPRATSATAIPILGPALFGRGRLFAPVSQEPSWLAVVYG